MVTASHHKNIVLVLQETLTFPEHIEEAIIKGRGGIDITRFLLIVCTMMFLCK